MNLPSLEFAAASDVGRRRSRNEDCIYFSSRDRHAVLADGMGGHQAGDVASQMAVDVVVKVLADGRQPEEDLDHLLARAVRQANAEVFGRAQGNALLAGMGTTLLIAVWEGWACHLAHVGDARAYLWRAGKLRRLTRDHTLYEDFMGGRIADLGGVPPGLARSFLSRAIGGEGDVQPDLDHQAVLVGDLVMLCSDGLTDMLGDEELGNIFSGWGAGSLPGLAEHLIAEANRMGGADNISVVLTRVRGNGAGDSRLADGNLVEE